MASSIIDTGHGATAVLTTSALAFSWTSIDCGEQTIPDVDRTHLATTDFREYVAGDLKEPNEVTMPALWDVQAAATSLDDIGGGDTLTITWAMPPAGGTSAPNLAGSGYIKRIKYPNLQTDTIQDGEVNFKFDGITGPTWTDYVA